MPVRSFTMSALVAATLWFGATSAVAAPNYSRCVSQPNPPECLARAGLAGKPRYERDVLDAVVRHGLVDEVSRRSKPLITAVGRRSGLLNIFLADMALDFPGSAAARLTDAQRSRISLAAIALMAAARRTPAQFAD